MKLKNTTKIKGQFPTQNDFVMLIEHKMTHQFCGWYSTKNGFTNELTKKLNTLKNHHKYSVKYLQGDNAGKNELFLKEINRKDWCVGVTPKWMPHATSQPNYVENPIYIMTMDGHALLAVKKVPDNCKNVLMSYSFQYAYMLRRLEVIKIDGKSCMHYEHLCRDLQKFTDYIRSFSEAIMMKDCPTNAPKSRKRGFTFIFYWLQLHK